MKEKRMLVSIKKLIPQLEELREGVLIGGFTEVNNKVYVTENSQNNEYCSANEECTNNRKHCISNKQCDNNGTCTNNKATCSSNGSCNGYVPILPPVKNLTINCND